jgi:hypothetical protein
MAGEYKKGKCQKQHKRREKSKLVPICVARSVIHASRERNTGSKGINETKLRMLEKRTKKKKSEKIRLAELLT